MLPTHHASASPSTSSRQPTTLARVLFRRAKAAAFKRGRKHLRRHGRAYQVAAVVCCSVLLTAALFTSLVAGGVAPRTAPGGQPANARLEPPHTTEAAQADYVVKPPPGAVPPPLLQPPTGLGAVYTGGESQSEEASYSGVGGA